MWTAAPSSRTSMMRMPCRATWSQIGWMWPPCKPNTPSTPRALRTRGTQAAPVFRSPISTPRQLGAQNAMQDLPGRGTRHFAVLDERDRTRPLVAGDLVLAPIDDLGVGGVGAGMQHDYRMD